MESSKVVFEGSLEQRQREKIATLGRALLVLHAPTDAVVGIENAARIFAAAKHPESFVSLDTADHFLSRADDSDYVAGVIAAWTSRYLPVARRPEAAETTDDAVIVESTGRGLFQHQVRIGRHSLLVDEPRAQGGLDSGPSPYDLLAASLGACKAMTIRLYVERKGWPIDAIRVRGMHAKIHAADCADCETRDGRMDELRCELEIRGALTGEQRAHCRDR